MKKFVLATALAALLPAAHAVEFNQVQPDKSAVSFVYKQMGVAVDGRFRKFSGQLAFDPANPKRPRRHSTSTWPASTPALRKVTRRSPASRGSIPGPSRAPASFPARSSRSVATATKSPAS
jgi:hypothetical protein